MGVTQVLPDLQAIAEAVLEQAADRAGLGLVLVEAGLAGKTLHRNEAVGAGKSVPSCGRNAVEEPVVSF